MSDELAIEITIAMSITDIGQRDWDACAAPDPSRPKDPFTTYRFLKALEDSQSVGDASGWLPRYISAKRDGLIIAVAPLYLKTHSQGEYIFDFNIAQAYEQAGGRYYPKFQVAVPFTPATGRRFLCRPGYEVQGMNALVQGIVQIASDNDISSLHATFCTEAEAIAGTQMGLLRRTSQQFHWVNQGYDDFDAFLGDLSSRKRKNIRKERRTAQEFGGEIIQLTGADIQPHHWDAFWQFYQDTGARKWGTPYLTRAFFDCAQDTLRDDLLLVLAVRDGDFIAGALNVIGQDTLFGRYWGCVEDHACLHFELCYYQAIDWAIKNGLARVEAGAQGEHKLARGYLPTTTHSLHWFSDPSFGEAVERFLEAETDAVSRDVEYLSKFAPFKKD